MQNEPLVQDPLYQTLEQEGEVAIQWRTLLGQSSRIRQAGRYCEMHWAKGDVIFYTDEDGVCQWQKPQEVVQLDRELYGWTQLKLHSQRVETFGECHGWCWQHWHGLADLADLAASGTER